MMGMSKLLATENFAKLRAEIVELSAGFCKLPKPIKWMFIADTAMEIVILIRQYTR
jgi:hypothetical protein